MAAPAQAREPEAQGAPAAAEALEAALHSLGPLGLYQGYTLLLLCIPNLLAPMYSLNYIFVADQVPFRCAVPECEGGAPAGWQYAAAAPAALLQGAPPCERPAPANGSSPALTCSPDDFLDTMQPCDQFVYESMDTTFAEFSLGCREWLRTLVGTVRNAALPLALLLTGYVSDTFGRRAAFCLFAGCMGVLGVAKALSVTYPMYLALEFLEAALGYGFTSAAYVLAVELARPSTRAAFACLSGVAYGLGGVLFAALAWRVRHWRRLLLLVHGAALLLPLYRLLVDESARWLHAQGRSHDAANILRKAAQWNKVTLDEEVMEKVVSEETAHVGEGESKREPQSGARSFASVVRSRALRVRLALCAWSWVAVAFVYYGLTINSVSLAGDKYVNFALNMAMEVVASLLLAMALERLGRRRAVSSAFLLCGGACVAPFFIAHSGWRLALFFVGKLAITFAFNGLYVFTAELFPTRARSSALAACSLVGRLGSIAAPMTPLLNVSIQAGMYGACSLLAALSVLLVPETRRAALPHSARAAELLRGGAAAPPPPPYAQPPPAPSPRVLTADT